MITFREATRTFFLETPRSSYIFKIHDPGILAQLYYGKKISRDPLTYLSRQYTGPLGLTLPGMDGSKGSMDFLPNEFPVYGFGDFGVPSIEVTYEDGNRSCMPVYESHRIYDGKPALREMPGFSAGAKDAQTLEILLRDELLRLEVTLCYTVYEEIDLIIRSAKVSNLGESRLRLNRLSSASLSLPDSDYRLLQLWGTHNKEYQMDVAPLSRGAHLIESCRGSSSHQHNPFAALLGADAGEDHGSVYGFSLVYSGNFRFSVEVDQMSATRVNMGINPFGFEWTLESGESFSTPEALLVYSGEGLTAMSHTFHTACRRFLGVSKYRGKPRPVVLNSWEAVYMDFDEAKLIGMIREAASLGVDIFVLDDGWYGERMNDSVSLGDWVVNKKKLPNGLGPVTKACRDNGMGFGIWIEPEMVCENSDLYRAHPDWPIQLKGRRHCTGRNQLVLDFSREEVIDHIYRQIHTLLSENDIAYVKWDMNRYISNCGSACLPAERQGELFHRQILGVYRLMGMLTKAFPDILFEGCSSGGGRFDFGILYYMPQIWTSDNSDAISRLKIQYGASMVYPMSAMVGHVSSVPNHQTGRVTPLKTRADVAMTCNFGYELNPVHFTAEEKEEVRNQIKRQKKIGDLVINGDFYRLQSPYGNQSCAWAMASRDGRAAVVVFVQVLTETALPVRTVKVKGLRAELSYFVEELDTVIRGDVLMNAGLPLEAQRKDFSSAVYTITAAG